MQLFKLLLVETVVDLAVVTADGASDASVADEDSPTAGVDVSGSVVGAIDDISPSGSELVGPIDKYEIIVIVNGIANSIVVLLSTSYRCMSDHRGTHSRSMLKLFNLFIILKEYIRPTDGDPSTHVIIALSPLIKFITDKRVRNKIENIFAHQINNILSIIIDIKYWKM